MHRDMAQCLQFLRKEIPNSEKIYNTSIKLLFSKSDKDRDALLSVCLAFLGQPDVFKNHVMQLVELQENQPVWGKPLYDGQVFPVLPITRNFMYNDLTSATTHRISDVSFGDFVDLNGDGYPDLVVSFYCPDYEFSIPWNIPYYYKATFINVKTGWQMVACEWSMKEVWNEFQWLGVPCPN
jgi:hypothetical protein